MPVGVITMSSVEEFFDAYFGPRQHDAHMLAFLRDQHLKRERAAYAENYARVSAWVDDYCKNYGGENASSENRS